MYCKNILMEGLPPELTLDFVDDEEPEAWTATDEPTADLSPVPEPAIAHLVEKKPIVEDAIFASDVEPTPPKSKPKEVKEVKEVKKPRAKPERPVKLNKNGQPRKKREYTEEQRQAMRERMAQVRAQSGKNKAKKEEEKAQEARYKELMKKKKELEMQEVEEKLKQKKEPKPVSETPKPKGLTMDDLRKAQFEAIAQYDTLRKKRKEEKKQKQKVQQYHQDVKNNLRKELAWRDVAGEYADYLGI